MRIYRSGDLPPLPDHSPHEPDGADAAPTYYYEADDPESGNWRLIAFTCPDGWDVPPETKTPQGRINGGPFNTPVRIILCDRYEAEAVEAALQQGIDPAPGVRRLHEPAPNNDTGPPTATLTAAQSAVRDRS